MYDLTVQMKNKENKFRSGVEEQYANRDGVFGYEELGVYEQETDKTIAYMESYKKKWF